MWVFIGITIAVIGMGVLAVVASIPVPRRPIVRNSDKKGIHEHTN